MNTYNPTAVGTRLPVTARFGAYPSTARGKSNVNFSDRLLEHFSEVLSDCGTYRVQDKPENRKADGQYFREPLYPVSHGQDGRARLPGCSAGSNLEIRSYFTALPWKA